jgi:hypothetical protein
MASTARHTAACEEQIASEEQNVGETSMWADIAGDLLEGATAIAGLAIGGPSGAVIGGP